MQENRRRKMCWHLHSLLLLCTVLFLKMELRGELGMTPTVEMTVAIKMHSKNCFSSVSYKNFEHNRSLTNNPKKSVYCKFTLYNL